MGHAFYSDLRLVHIITHVLPFLIEISKISSLYEEEVVFIKLLTHLTFSSTLTGIGLWQAHFAAHLFPRTSLALVLSLVLRSR